MPFPRKEAASLAVILETTLLIFCHLQHLIICPTYSFFSCHHHHEWISFQNYLAGHWLQFNTSCSLVVKSRTRNLNASFPSLINLTRSLCFALASDKALGYKIFSFMSPDCSEFYFVVLHAHMFWALFVVPDHHDQMSQFLTNSIWQVSTEGHTLNLSSPYSLKSTQNLLLML